MSDHLPVFENVTIALNDQVYDRLIEALMRAPRRCQWTGEPDASAIKLALCEIGDIVPASCLEKI